MTTEAAVSRPSSAAVAPAAGSDEQKALRRSLGQFPTGVTVITLESDGQRAGMTANSFSSVSLEPPLILWSIRKASGRAALFTQTEKFAVSVLAAEQIDVARNFASSAADPFELSAWHTGRSGVPLIDGAVAHFECQLESVVDAGDHHIILGRVIHHQAFDGTPLLFAQGQFALPAQPKSELDAVAGKNGAQMTAPRSAVRLLRKAYSSVSGGFAEQRTELGLDPVSSRVLAVLDEKKAALEGIAREACADLTAVADSLAELSAKGLVTALDGSLYGLTAQGLAKRQQVAARVNAYAERRFASFTPEEIETLERLLAKIDS